MKLIDLEQTLCAGGQKVGYPLARSPEVPLPLSHAHAGWSSAGIPPSRRRPDPGHEATLVVECVSKQAGQSSVASGVRCSASRRCWSRA